MTDNDKKTFTGLKEDSSQHEMELLSILECLEYIKNHFGNAWVVRIYTDSEYVANLLKRRRKLEDTKFLTRKGKRIAHSDLIKKMYRFVDEFFLEINRVPSHQKKGVSAISDLNREVDKLSRKILRKEIRDQ